MTDKHVQTPEPEDASARESALGLPPAGTPRGLRDIWTRPASFMERVTDTITWVSNTRIMRSNTRYGKARGALLSGGVTYSALFAIGAALTIAWTAFMATLGSNDELRAQMISSVNSYVPRLLKEGNNGGIVDPNDLVLDSGINLTSIVAALVLLWTAISVMGGLANAIRATFGMTQIVSNFFVNVARNLAAFLVIVFGIALSAVLGSVAGSLGVHIFVALGIPGSQLRVLLRVVGFLLSASVNTGVILFLIRVLAGVKVPRRDFLVGGSIGGVALAVIQLLGTSAVGSVGSNPVLASFASLATLLLWLNLSVRILLQACAYMANPPRPYAPSSSAELHGPDAPNYVTISEPHTLEWAYDPLSGNLLPDPSAAEDKEDLPEWGGIQGRLARRKAEKLEASAIDARQRADDAWARYREGQRRVAAEARDAEGKK